ncbi:MAG: GntR family transcriptional regulator, partial [Pseudomonadota bacterium]
RESAANVSGVLFYLAHSRVTTVREFLQLIERTTLLFIQIENNSNHPVASEPLYRKVEHYIRGFINRGEWVPGDLIPSEPQLSETLDVSIGTVRKAIDQLEKEKLLYRHQGKGTYVSRIDFDNSLFRFFSYGTASGESARIHKTTPRRERIPGTSEICQHLDLPIGTPLIYIERVGYDDDDQPVLLEKCWWRADIVEGLEDEELHIPDLFYALIEEKFNVHVVRAEETLTADIADKNTASILQINAGDPLVVLRRTTHATNDRIIEYRVTHGRPDRFSYKTEIR